MASAGRAGLRDHDLSWMFATPRLPAELPDEIFAGGDGSGPPVVAAAPAAVVPADDLVLEPGLPVPGTVLGKYRLERTIGIGGFGAVYRARHVLLDSVVALKLMRPSVTRARPGLLRLLTEEARFAARIDHANVVRVFDVATSNDHTYIVMEHVDGPDLAVMTRHRGALPYKMVVRVLRHIAAALAAGLAEKLIHRDVKPSNILLTRAGVTKLADFGLARSTSAAEVSGLRGVVGTAAYMSPEQASDPRRVDFRSDIYSLGITAYHALTGGLPYAHADPAREPAAVHPPSWFVGGVPPALDELVLAMMARDRDDRPASYAVLDGALRAIR